MFAHIFWIRRAIKFDVKKSQMNYNLEREYSIEQNPVARSARKRQRATAAKHLMTRAAWGAQNPCRPASISRMISFIAAAYVHTAFSPALYVCIQCPQETKSMHSLLAFLVSAEDHRRSGRAKERSFWADRKACWYVRSHSLIVPPSSLILHLL